MPSDVLAEKVNSGRLHAEPACQAYPAYAPARSEAVEHAADLLLQAERPVCVAGGGAVTSGMAEMTALAEALAWPWVPPSVARGHREDHPSAWRRRRQRRPAYANTLLAEADLILYVGCKTDS